MMNLKPRFSLLTFLIAMGITLAGVKLWRGPHRGILHNPPTPEEQKLLSTCPNTLGIVPDDPTVPELKYEYTYQQNFGGREYLSVRIIPVDRTEFPLVRQEASDDCLLLWENNIRLDKSRSPPANARDAEYLHHACYLRRCPILAQLNMGPDEGIYPFLYISTKGHVYAINHVKPLLALKRVNLSEMTACEAECLRQEIELARK